MLALLTIIQAAASPADEQADISRWAALLTGKSSSSNFWTDGAVPPLQQARFKGGKLKPGNLTMRGYCPSVLYHPEAWASAPACRNYWPTGMENYKCHVLSVGIGDEWSFEDAAIGRHRTTPGDDPRNHMTIPAVRRPPTNCSVHAFDPTKGFKAQHEKHAASEVGELASHVRFHYAGLRGDAPSMSTPVAESAANGRGKQHGDTRNTCIQSRIELVTSERCDDGRLPVPGYCCSCSAAVLPVLALKALRTGSIVLGADGLIDHTVLHTLEELTVHAGMTDTKGLPLSPDVLKVDCEGCEWSAFAQIARAGRQMLRHTRLLFLELHVASTMIQPTPSEFVGLFNLVVRDLGFRLWYVRNNNGRKKDRKVVSFLDGPLTSGQCCYELAFWRDLPPRMRRNKAVV